MPKPILVSGIQPSGKLHIGNYLGALKNFVELQNSGKYQCYFFIADLHSLTEAYEPKEKAKQTLELFADYIAAGLNPKKSVLYLQSQIPAHSELAWIFNTVVPVGELQRMTQFKDKSEHQKENVNAGILTYPALMAADILLYDAKFVPVGDDQDQHLELTRTIARKFNGKYGQTFFEPKALHTATPRVMSLANPAKKMSKSVPDSCLFLSDEPEIIKQKIGRAVTDSGTEVKYDPEGKPGISNLMGIYSALSGKSVEQIENMFAGKSYADFKSSVAETVANHFADFRKKKKALIAKPKALISALKSGSKKAEKIANKKMVVVKKITGIAL